MISAHGIVRADGAVRTAELREWTTFDDGEPYAEEGVALEAGIAGGDAPVRTADGTRIWVLGEVHGFDGSVLSGAGDVPKSPDVDDGRYCRALYEQYGTEFVRGLNGNFTLVVHDRAEKRLSVCTDRLGTVPVYHARPDDDTLVFSTNVQDLPSHPAVETSFQSQYLHEYLAFRRTFGVKTPLSGIEELQPGAITTFDLTDGSTTVSEYWRPRYRPLEQPFEWFVDEFTRRFRQAIEASSTPDRSSGVLFSGGSDSRLVLAGLDDATAFHMNDWMNREARIAERAALEADAEFVMLRRGADYRIDALDRNGELSNFSGWFTQAYTTGFESEITDRVDELLTGLYGDTLFKRFSVPSPEVSLSRVGSVSLPVRRRIETVDEYVDLLVEAAHDGFDLPTDLREVLETNIYRTGDGIVHHGVTYDSLDELLYYGECYPLSNDDDMIFYTALRRALPSRAPFLDDRLLDLSLSMPVRYRLRRNVVNRALDRIAPNLASIPHAQTGVPPSRAFPVAYLGEHLREFWRTHLSRETPPEPYMTDGPWPDDAELVRTDDFLLEAFEEAEATADALPGIDAGNVRELYRAHQNGDNRVAELYSLLTVLTMPVTERVVRESSGYRTVEEPPNARYEGVSDRVRRQ